MRGAWLVGVVLGLGCVPHPPSSSQDAGAEPADAAVTDAAGPDSGGADAHAVDSSVQDAGIPDAAVGGDAAVRPDAALPPDAAAAEDAGNRVDECPAEAVLCLSATSRRGCVETPQGRRWAEETCGPGSGCVNGWCVSTQCADECNLGDISPRGTCVLMDLASQVAVAPNVELSLHDRARDYTRWLRRDGMAADGVGSARYSDPPVYSQLEYLDGIGDSAIWTGTYLAAEALRLKSTGALDAREEVKHLVDILHLWFNVSGDPGMLARWAAPSGAVFRATVGDLHCGDGRSHCGVSYGGGSYDYIGHISRDQYQGVLMGYVQAYQALGPADEATRALIRDDVVEIVRELMMERQVPIKLSYNGTVLPQVTAAMRFVVLAPDEMEDGAVRLNIDTAHPEESTMFGFQEFMPDLALLVRQVPLMGWVPSIPRASSAVMLAAFFRAGLLVTEGVPGQEVNHADILDYYLHHGSPGGNIQDWLQVAATYGDTNACGESYFGHNISMEPMYSLAQLEDDPALHAAVVATLAGKMWPLFRATKNSFFAFIYAGNVADYEGAAVSTGLEQLAQFPPPPRVDVAVDLRTDARYLPHQDGCPDQVSHSTSVDVKDRPPSDFLWQRHPWSLYAAGNVAQTQPGVDYLVAYWMARRHGWLADDAAGRCLRWQR